MTRILVPGSQRHSRAWISDIVIEYRVWSIGSDIETDIRSDTEKTPAISYRMQNTNILGLQGIGRMGRDLLVFGQSPCFSLAGCVIHYVFAYIV